MKPSHLAGVQWLAAETGAEVVGMEVKSRELWFRPRRRVGEDERGEDTKNGVWTNVYQKGRLVRRDSEIVMSTPGSIFLVFQAIFPYILFSAYASLQNSAISSDGSDATVPVRITIHGGTNVSKAPSFEYIDQVLFPMLQSKVGIPAVDMRLNGRGWTQGRGDVGSVTFDITPLKPGSLLPQFSLVSRGEVTKIHVSILASGAGTRTRIRDKVIERLLDHHPDVEILFPVNEDSQHSMRLYLLLVAETSSGFRLGRDWLFDRKTGSPHAANQLVQQVVDDLEQELEHGGCVDEYLQDQLVIFQALAKGKALIDSGKRTEASLHTRTVRWVAEKMLGMVFDEGACEGTSYRVDERYWERHEIDAGESLISRELDEIKL